jgi:hypothetical protein
LALQEEFALYMYNERRAKSRYPIALNVRYQTMCETDPTMGVGRTVNMSSSGTLIACRKKLAEGTRLKMFVEWPSLLNGTTPLQLITVGTVIRCTRFGMSVMFESYQFRTMGRTRAYNVTKMPDRTAPPKVAEEPLTLVAKTSS